MSNWDLMMPGMGLTAIGIAGLTLAYAGIAHTFIDGMHALTGLTMFVGLIFLAAGILDGGISTSNRAKATTLVILSIALGFGMYAMVLNTSNYTITIAGILMAIAFPAIVIAYLAMKHPTIVKPVGTIVGIAAATGIIMWVSFGIFSSPDTYMIPQQIEVEEPEEKIVSDAPIFEIVILADSATVGNPDYGPDTAIVTHGHTIQWTNADTVAHTVTSSADFGETFGSSLLNAGDTYTLDTNKLEPGTHEYQCAVHEYMVATIVIEAEGESGQVTSMEEEPTKIIIPQGAAIMSEEQIYYDPETIKIPVGTTIKWKNADNTLHTATYGTVGGEEEAIFDSSILAAEESYEYTFDSAGEYDYYCLLHTWMTGTISVE